MAAENTSTPFACHMTPGATSDTLVLVVAPIVSAARMPTNAADMSGSRMRNFRRTAVEALMMSLAVMLLPRMMHGEDWCVATGIHRQAVGVGRVTMCRIAIGRAVIGP